MTNSQKPQLWSDKNPFLYRINASIGKENIGSREASFGIRNIKMIAKKGFFVNGENIKLKGVSFAMTAVFWARLFTAKTGADGS